MTINSWPRPKPSETDAELVNDFTQAIAVGIEEMALKNPQAPEIIKAVLRNVVGNVVDSARIKFEFEPELKHTDFQVSVTCHLFADSQDEGMETTTRTWATQSTPIVLQDIRVVAATVCADVVFLCYKAVKVLSEEMFMAPRHSEIENAFFHAAFTTIDGEPDGE